MLYNPNTTPYDTVPDIDPDEVAKDLIALHDLVGKLLTLSDDEFSEVVRRAREEGLL